MDAVSIPTQPHILHGKWHFYYHLPHDKNWGLSSYTVIMDSIDTVEKVITLNESINENVVKNCMLFVMKKGIAPMWEDVQNARGGCFQYKIMNKNVPDVWKECIYALVGGTLSENRAFVGTITGFTSSPKKDFCIFKLWTSTCTNQNPMVVTNEIGGIKPQGCIFKKHSP